MDRLTAIPLKPSHIALYLHAAVLLLAVIALWLCGLSVWLKFLLTILLSGLSFREYQKQKYVLFSAIGFEQEHWWALVHNQKVMIELLNEQLVLPWLIVLNFRVNQSDEKESGKKYSLALWADMAHVDDLRRLRVFLGNQ